LVFIDNGESFQRKSVDETPLTSSFDLTCSKNRKKSIKKGGAKN
jgi:hypothetical protein